MLVAEGGARPVAPGLPSNPKDKEQSAGKTREIHRKSNFIPSLLMIKNHERMLNFRLFVS